MSSSFYQSKLPGKNFFLFILISLSVFIPAQNAVPVEVAKVSIEDVIIEVPVTGTVRSLYISNISSSVQGLIEKIHVEVGDYVEAGATLVRLDSELRELELQMAKVSVKEEAEKFAEARRRYLEAERLSRNNNIPKTEVESREAEVRVSQMALRGKEIETKYQAALLARYRIQAPFAGVINRRVAESGEWVSPGDHLVELVDINNLRVDFLVPQEYYHILNKKTPVVVQLPTGKDYYQSHIETIVAVSNDSMRSFLIRTQIDESVKITPGMSAQGILRITTGVKSVVISRDAVTRYPNGRTTVWLLQDKGTVQERRIQLGKSFGNKTEVLSGLKEADIVVVKGNNALRDGQKVNVKNSR